MPALGFNWLVILRGLSEVVRASAGQKDIESIEIVVSLLLRVFRFNILPNGVFSLIVEV